MVSLRPHECPILSYKNELTPELLLGLVSSSRIKVYIGATAAALFVYDWLLLLSREIQAGIYRAAKKRSTSTTIYVLMKIFGIIFFLGIFLNSVNPRPTKKSCTAASWMFALPIFLGYTPLLKTLLILRLRALYRYEKKVSMLLYTLLAIEIMSGLLALSAAMGVYMVSTPLPVFPPLMGCVLSTPSGMLAVVYGSALTISWIVRLVTSSIELILMIYKLLTTLNTGEVISFLMLTQIKKLTPVLYVFYRDGMLMFIPIFFINTLGFIASVQGIKTNLFNTIDWDVWLVIVYQVFGSRLILNLCNANAELIGTTISRPAISALRFDRPQETENQRGSGDGD